MCRRETYALRRLERHEAAPYDAAKLPTMPVALRNTIVLQGDSHERRGAMSDYSQTIREVCAAFTTYERREGQLLTMSTAKGHPDRVPSLHVCYGEDDRFGEQEAGACRDGHCSE